MSNTKIIPLTVILKTTSNFTFYYITNKKSPTLLFLNSFYIVYKSDIDKAKKPTSFETIGKY